MYNDDYVKGLKFVISKCHDMGIEIKKYPWVADLCGILARHNRCYYLWDNCYKQKRLHNITGYNTLYDLLIADRAFVLWRDLEEGDTYWSEFFGLIFWENELELLKKGFDIDFYNKFRQKLIDTPINKINIF